MIVSHKEIFYCRFALQQPKSLHRVGLKCFSNVWVGRSIQHYYNQGIAIRPQIVCGSRF